MKTKLLLILLCFACLPLMFLGCEQTSSKPPDTSHTVLAIAIDPTVPDTLNRLETKWTPIFKSVVQHKISVLIVRLGDGDPIKFAGQATSADVLMAAITAASQRSPTSGSPLYPGTQTVREWLLTPAHKDAAEIVVFVTDTVCDTQKVNGHARNTYRSMFDVKFTSLPNAKIHFIGVPTERAATVKANIPTADVALAGAEAEALTPARLNLPEYEEDEL